MPNIFRISLQKLLFSFSLVFFISIASVTQADTLGQRAIYTVKILPAGDPAEVDQCSAFAFGDISGGGGLCVGGFSDNTAPPPPTLTDGDGIAGDGLAGTLTIETGRVDGAGNNTFTVNAFQMDPYLGTPGGTFKTTMSLPDGALPPIDSGTVTAAGDMVLDVTGRTGVSQFQEATIGIQPWNLDDCTKAGCTAVTGVYEGFTTGASNNWDPVTGAVSVTLTGRQIGDANTDSILDAVLVSVGNVGAAWGAFDGTPYSEAFNVQFELVSAKPVAVPDLLVLPPVVASNITISTDLLANDLHADPAETISLDSFSPPVSAGSTLVQSGADTLIYTPDPALLGANADSFTYTIMDVAGETDTTTVTINIATGNSPVCNDTNTSTNEDESLTLDPVALDCTDPDMGDVLSIFSFDAFSAQGGTVVSAGGNSLTYTPPLNFFSPPVDSFEYRVTDGNGWVVSATVFITVNPVNDPLVCADVQNNTGIDEPLTIDIANDLLDTCTDVSNENDTITLAMVQTPTDQGGNVSSDGVTLTYTPPTGFEGTDTYTYTASDGTDTDTRTITTKVGIDFGNFTMLNVAGNVFGGTNDVLFTWDGTTNNDEVDYTNNLNFNMTIRSESSFAFNGFPWFAHTIRVFGPGTYSFDTACTVAEIEATGCPGTAGAPGVLSMTVGPGQLGVHILFDWSDSTNIDVVNVWNQNDVWNTYGDAPPKNELWTGAAGPSPDPKTTWALVSTDANGDGNNGVPMVDGPFQGYLANFNRSPGATAGTKPPYTGTAPDTKLGGGLFASPMNPWVLLSLFMTLFGLRRFSNKQ